jgi:type I restriction enzyme, S subunit
MSHSENIKWSRAPLSALGVLISGQSPASKFVNHDGRGTPYVSGPEQWTGEQVVIDKWTTSSANIVPERSIFIVMKGAGVGTVFPGRSAAIGRDIAAFVPYEPLNRDYVNIALREECKGLVDDARGHIPGLSRSMLLNLWLDIPPLAEQGRITQKLYEAEDLLRRATEQLQVARANADEIRGSVFNDAFSGEASKAWRREHEGQEAPGDSAAPSSDGPHGTGRVIRGRFALALGIPAESVPSHWAWRRLVDFAELRTGHTPSRREPNYWDGDIPWIGITDARENYGKVITDTRQHITQAGLENSSAEILPVGTVCLSRTASLGYVVVTGVPMATSQDFLNWTCQDQLDKDWLLWLFIAERDSFQRIGYGSTHKTIYMKDAARLYVLLPPLLEQREVVRFVEAGMSGVEAISKNLDDAESAAVTARDEAVEAALLGQAGTGDAGDVDAGILLGQLEENIEVTRAEASVEEAEDQGASAVSVERLVDVVRASAPGVSPEKLFASGGYQADAVDVFFAHIKAAVGDGDVRYDAANDLVIADEA